MRANNTQSHVGTQDIPLALHISWGGNVKGQGTNENHLGAIFWNFSNFINHTGPPSLTGRRNCLLRSKMSWQKRALLEPGKWAPLSSRSWGSVQREGPWGGKGRDDRRKDEAIKKRWDHKRKRWDHKRKRWGDRKNEAIEERDEVIEKRDEAIEKRDEAIEKRDEAIEEKEEAIEKRDEAQ